MRKKIEFKGVGIIMAKQFECVKKYSHIKGFNIQPDWGRNGTEIWLNFDAERYRRMIKIGKEKFPSMNTVRIWLSFDAWMHDSKTYIEAVKTAGEILTEEGLNIIPTYFNGWFGIPSFGGFTQESIQESMFPPYIKCLREMVMALEGANILVHDIANEPFNNAFWEFGYESIMKFLTAMSEELRKLDNRPITIGTQSMILDNKKMCDIDRLMPLVDVVSLHPYNFRDKDIEKFDEEIERLLDYIEPFGKPVIITECCWAAPTAQERLFYMETELPTFKKYGIGYLAQGLFTSPVADLHPIENVGRTEGLYMAFLDENFEIRPYHNIFNEM